MDVFDDPRHRESEELAHAAERAARAKQDGTARSLFAAAAALETSLVESLAHEPRIRSVLAVSAVALWLKADQPEKVQQYAKQYLEDTFLLPAEREQIQQLDEAAWKRRVIAHDAGILEKQGFLAGYKVVARGEARQPMTPEESRAAWEALAPKLVPINIYPGLARVLMVDGREAVAEAVLALKALREDLIPAIDDAVKRLRLSRFVQRAELKHLERMWRQEVAPRLTAENLRPIIDALVKKKPDSLHVWVQRVRKHRPDLVPLMVAILQELGL